MFLGWLQTVLCSPLLITCLVVPVPVRNLDLEEPYSYAPSDYHRVAVAASSSGYASVASAEYAAAAEHSVMYTAAPHGGSVPQYAHAAHAQYVMRIAGSGPALGQPVSAGQGPGQGPYSFSTSGATVTTSAGPGPGHVPGAARPDDYVADGMDRQHGGLYGRRAGPGGPGAGSGSVVQMRMNGPQPGSAHSSGPPPAGYDPPYATLPGPPRPAPAAQSFIRVDHGQTHAIRLPFPSGTPVQVTASSSAGE